jgi:hypothetical protein
MTTSRRITVIIAQLLAATIAGYIAAFLALFLISGLFEVGLIVAALIGGLVVAGVGRLFGMRGQTLLPLMGAAVGAGIGYAVLQMPFAVANMPLWLALMLIPGILAIAAYHWSDSRAPAA